MRKFLLAFTAVLMITMAAFIPAGEAQAQNVASVIYDFSAYPVPEGNLTTFTLDQGAMLNLLQKNADGTFAVDAAGNYYADQGAVSNFVSNLAILYELPGYTVLNQDMERQFLISAISQGSCVTRAPLITMSTVPAAADNAQAVIDEAKAKADTQEQTVTVPDGQTYIDISITDQKLVYYENGVPTIITDVVTGNESAHHDTPQGTFQVYNKATNRTLKGPGYSSFVRYWMPFTGNYGLHDASWRGSFGGSIYKTNGSHGCVNMPGNVAEVLFNTISVGTTVIIHS